MNYFILKLILCLLFTTGFATEPVIEIKTCLNYRTQQYPLGDYSAICVVSPIRTGSTLVYNVVRILFENSNNANLVHKSHTLNHLHTNHSGRNFLHIFTIRNPVDSVYSWRRVMKNNNLNDRDWIKKTIQTIINQWKMLVRLKELNQSVIVLRYEEFSNDINNVLTKLEDHLSISIHENDRLLVAKALSKENVLENIKNIDSFNKYNTVDHLHGYHIDQEDVSEEAKEEIKNIIREELEEFKDFFNQWEYTINCPM